MTEDTTTDQQGRVTPSPERTATGQVVNRRQVSYDDLFGAAESDAKRRHRAEGRSCDPVLGRLLLELWQAVLPPGHRPHRHENESLDLRDQLALLGPLDTPDLAVARRLVYLATKHAADTIAKISSDNRKLEQTLTGLQLKACVTEDENAHTREAVTKALKKRKESDDDAPEHTDDEPLPELIKKLLAGTAEPEKGGGELGDQIVAILDAGEVPEAEGDSILARIARLRRDHDEALAILKQIGLKS